MTTHTHSTPSVQSTKKSESSDVAEALTVLGETIKQFMGEELPFVAKRTPLAIEKLVNNLTDEQFTLAFRFAHHALIELATFPLGSEEAKAQINSRALRVGAIKRTRVSRH